MAREIIANSRQVFLCADHTKFGRNALVRLGDFEEIDALFTDQEPPPPLREHLDAHKVAVFVAEHEIGPIGSQTRPKFSIANIPGD